MSQSVELGTTPPDDARRDAVHVAIIPATYQSDADFACAGAGDKVSFQEDGLVQRCFTGQWDGIIDPFLEGFVESGSRIWVLMRPGHDPVEWYGTNFGTINRQGRTMENSE